jgi:predicted GNAT superfamily acetyltransferase
VTGSAIRALAAHADLEAAVRLQHEVWGYAPGEAVPLQMFIIAAETGGQLFGAFEAVATEHRMVGFCLAFAALKPDGRPYLYSHMLGVLTEYRDRHIGRALKLEQRREALARGIELVEWTFDPLETKNAYFNIERLGAIVRRYLPDHWGTTSSPLHGSVPTDRLVAEWWLREERGANRGQRPPIEARIAVPSDIDEARRMQAAIRERFLDCFGRGLAVVGFESGTYLLGKWPSA